MLFPSITVIDYTYITSVNEYSKSIMLLFKGIEVPYYGVLQPNVTYFTLKIQLKVRDKVPRRPAFTTLYANTCLCASFNTVTYFKYSFNKYL